MKNIIAIISILFMLSSAATAEERIKHYAANKPKDAASAMQNMQIDYEKISQIINQPDGLSDNDMEQIHEISYDLEASYEVLMSQLGVANGVQMQQLERLGQAIEQIHNVSENHDKNATLQAHEMLGQNLLNEETLGQLQNLPVIVDALQSK
jgi:hypothetical protein